MSREQDGIKEDLAPDMTFVQHLAIEHCFNFKENLFASSYTIIILVTALMFVVNSTSALIDLGAPSSFPQVPFHSIQSVRGLSYPEEE